MLPWLPKRLHNANYVDVNYQVVTSKTTSLLGLSAETYVYSHPRYDTSILNCNFTYLYFLGPMLKTVVSDDSDGY